MKDRIKINSALVSVFYKDKLDDLVHTLARNAVTFYSTGGTRTFIENLGYTVEKVEDVTSYPPILDGRVKTLHPKIFGGILAIRNDDHLAQLKQYEIPTIDLVIVDLYPFEETISNTDNLEDIIEKIDIGGISLIRAAAKNYHDVAVISSKEDYDQVNTWLASQNGGLTFQQRQWLATRAFATSSRYDMMIQNYLQEIHEPAGAIFTRHNSEFKSMRYGENPHQTAKFYGKFEDMFDTLGGKDLSYNNLVDVDAAVQLIREFLEAEPTFAILKHTNACGVCTRPMLAEAYAGALACDPTSAFGGVFITNTKVDETTAHEINKLFYEVLIAPEYDPAALDILLANPKRIILKCKTFTLPATTYKSVLNGVLNQDADFAMEDVSACKVVTRKSPSKEEFKDLQFALICAKHLKSNTIVLVKNQQMIGMGCGQTSRVDACEQAISKAKSFGFDVAGSAMASDAFFPFPDCVDIAWQAGIRAVVQPGGSIKDQLSIDFCDQHDMSMVLTGVRHFKH